MNIHPADDPPDAMSHDDRTRARLAARRVKRQYPGPVGDVLAAELDSWADMGWRLDPAGLIHRLIDHVLEPPAETAA